MSQQVRPLAALAEGLSSVLSTLWGLTVDCSYSSRDPADSYGPYRNGTNMGHIYRWT